MIDITSILIPLILLCVAVVSIFLVPLIRDRRREYRDYSIAVVVDNACKWAQQHLKGYSGKQKRERVIAYVKQWLNKRGYTYDENEIAVLLSSCVFDIKASLDSELTVKPNDITEDVQ